MTLGWPAALVIVAIIFSAVAVWATRIGIKGSLEVEEAKAKSGEGYQLLSADYEKLAVETREGLAAMRSDLAAVRTSVEAIEQMMRDVG